MKAGMGFPTPAFARRFVAPDTGPHQTPYACTFHWLRLPDGRICGIDLIRSDDTGQLGLRVFVVGEDGGIRRLVKMAPAEAWPPFATDARPDALGGAEEVLGRGPGWVSAHAHVEASAGGLGDVRFELQVEPETMGLGTGGAALSLLYLGFLDFRRVRTTGTLILDGERHAIDALGPCSIHFGAKLPEYGYLATVPRDASRGSDLLLVSAASNNVRYLGGLLGDITLTYAYRADAALPHVRLGRYPQPVRVGRERLELDGVVHAEYELLGRTTLTGSARGAMVTPDGARRDLGLVIFDFHGDRYAKLSPRSSEGAQRGEGASVPPPAVAVAP